MDKKHIPDQSDQEERTDGKGENGAGGKTKRFDLSLAQVMGSAVATVIAAFLAGQLGVYGTFLGAGMVSLVATSGGPIFQHLFRRTGEQIKEVAVPPARVTKAGGRQLPVRDPAGGGWKDDSGLDATQAMRGSGQVPAAEPPKHHTQATQLFPSASPQDGGEESGGAKNEGAGERSPDQVQLLDTAMLTGMLPGARGWSAAGGDSDEATRLLGAVEGPGEGARPGQVPEDKLPGDGEFTGASVHGTRWRGWKRTLLPAVVVFVIAMGGVTVYEAIAGHNVSGGKGVSVTDLFRPGGGSSGDSPDAPPATPDPGQSEDGGDGATGGDGSNGPSADPETGEKHSPGENGSGDGSTPAPDPSTPQQPGDSGDPGHTKDPGSPGDGSGSGNEQEGTDSGSGTDQNNGGAGSGQLPQRQQNEPAPG